jgi:hypothetical protein
MVSNHSSISGDEAMNPSARAVMSSKFFPAAVLQADEWPFLEVPDDGDAGILPHDLVHEWHGLPVQQRVDNVWLDLEYLLLPAGRIEIRDVAER